MIACSTPSRAEGLGEGEASGRHKAAVDFGKRKSN